MAIAQTVSPRDFEKFSKRVKKHKNSFKEKEQSERTQVRDLLDQYDVPLKQRNKISKHVGIDRFRTLERMETIDLKDLIARASMEIKKAVDETEANENFQTAVANLKVFKDALRDTIEPYKANIELAVNLLEWHKLRETPQNS